MTDRLVQVLEGDTSSEDRPCTGLDKPVGQALPCYLVKELHATKAVVDKHVGGHQLVNEELLNEGHGALVREVRLCRDFFCDFLRLRVGCV